MTMVAEGYYAVKSIIEINKKTRLELPIVDTVYNILYNNRAAKKEMSKLTEKLG
jgi:glycerol-3-phosphate dehydrogenase (NAD(P)+)